VTRIGEQAALELERTTDVSRKINLLLAARNTGLPLDHVDYLSTIPRERWRYVDTAWTLLQANR
jgi:hypothetical protein